jgi:hypothetical protein
MSETKLEVPMTTIPDAKKQKMSIDESPDNEWPEGEFSVDLSEVLASFYNLPCRAVP